MRLRRRLATPVAALAVALLATGCSIPLDSDATVVGPAPDARPADPSAVDPPADDPSAPDPEAGRNLEHDQEPRDPPAPDAGPEETPGDGPDEDLDEG